MKDKPSEWIAISDLMAGVTAVVMLLLVVAVLQKSVSELHYQELAKAAELERSQRKDPTAQLKQALKAMMNDEGTSSLMVLDSKSNRLTLADSVFERGSACLHDEVKTACQLGAGKIGEFFEGKPQSSDLCGGVHR